MSGGPAAGFVQPRVRSAARILTRLAVLWGFLVAVHLLLFYITPGTARTEHALGYDARLSLVLLECLGLALLAVILLVPILVLDRLNRHADDIRPPLLWAGRVGLVSVLWWLLLLYGSSWASFRSTGQFLDAGGLAFWLGDAVQFFQHVAHLEPYTLLIVPMLTLLAAIGLALLVPSLPRRLAPRTNQLVAATVGLMAVVVLLAAWDGGRGVAGSRHGVIDPDVGVIYTVGDLYSTLRDERSGPVLHFIGDLRYRLGAEAGPVFASDAIPVVRRRQVSMEEYLGPVDAEDVNRWNVIIIIVESLRNDQLLAYGGTREVMPAVDSLARNARVFTDHYTQSSHSNYSDLAPLSSHYPLRSPRYHVYPEDPTYPRVLLYDVLKALGYQVGIFSSQNENWGGMINYLRTGSIDTLLHAENFRGATYVPRGDVGFTAFIRGSKRSGKIDDRFTIGAAIDWIDGLEGTPFFLYLNLQNSHIPYEVPSDFSPPFGPRKVGFPITFGYYPPDSTPVVKDLYANSLAYVDAQLRRLFDYLGRSGLTNKSVIVITGDTGQAFWEHGFIAHANQLYDEVMRVPLIVSAPGLEPAADGRPAQHIDVPPSVHTLLKLPPHPGYQGIDLFGERVDADRGRYLVAQSPLAHQYAVVRSGFKLIFDARWGRYVLYDLERDPRESLDMSARLTDVARELATWLDTWRKVQLDYYGNPQYHERWYPPVLAE